MQEQGLRDVLRAAEQVARAVPELDAFIRWPSSMAYNPRDRNLIAGVEELRAHPGCASALTMPLQRALIAAAEDVEWRLTYSEEEVGADFLSRFGWFELAGPHEGHFITDETRMTVGYWGPNLHYPWHLHEPEELYFIVSGEAMFEVEGQAPKLLRAGDTAFHGANQPHAMTTHDSGLLAFVLWRGAGLADPPRMGNE
ncbi:dimethylsulfonioproprionate lyase family protein [Cochlodiniinecator piscidefendens]|uniref:dimethylsulfonioproprionate lyase family protein n=1 Tax=Cochlodiniinecator piscidefendens TaxID=2715756 RepID=UPI0014085648|nr:dimethylsulfonioproprionate lyase family protein [Cochlodiniinecator piscidefendens]